jgi:hypothetical protein
MIKKTSLIILLLLSFSCGPNTVTGSSDDEYFQLWKTHNIHNYAIDQTRSCFCPERGPVRITVRSDSIYRVVRISDSEAIASSYFLSIDSLFGIIRNSNDDSLVIKYNTKYGYPEYLDIYPQLHPIDGGVLYETSNLQAY